MQHGLANVGESGEAAQHDLANVCESGESAQHGLANVGKSGESRTFQKTAVLASTRTRQKRRVSREYSNLLNSPASSHCLVFIINNESKNKNKKLNKQNNTKENKKKKNNINFILNRHLLTGKSVFQLVK